LSPGDYFNYADIALRKRQSRRSQAVLEEGFAANTVSRSDPSFSQLYSLRQRGTKGDRESLPAAARADSNARQTLNTGDAYFGYGDHAKAVEFYRAALTKPGPMPTSSTCNREWRLLARATGRARRPR
jgi:hypothetical protein